MTRPNENPLTPDSLAADGMQGAKAKALGPCRAKHTRGQAIAAKCRECIHDPMAAGTWREQVAACCCTDCPLWAFRPVQDRRSAPDWILARDPAFLPEGFTRLYHDDAIRTMRENVADKVNRTWKTDVPQTVQGGAATTLPGAQ